VHGQGLDEITTTGATQVAEWREGQIRLFNVTPEAVGLARSTLADLRGGGSEDNALALSRLLKGESGAYRDVVLINAAAAFLICGKCETLREGVALAARSIDSGAAERALGALVAISNGL
jgi:anthranilate phosphoribosyltransferase